MNAEILIPVLLLIVAFLYASVGHGGASGYIAVLTLFNIPLAVYKPVVLILNIVIASIAFIQFYRAGYFKWKLAWPFLITSIPCAFLGSHFTTSEHMYKLLLGIALIFPVIRLLTKAPKEKTDQKDVVIIAALVIGAVIGFASGFLNIGGGIFLSPVIILLAWGNAKEAAAVSSLFIVCNSLSGLAAVSNGINFTSASWIWLTAAIIGGLLGAYMGSVKYKLITVRYVLALVLCIASLKLIFG
ncbi:sulfite exporter TauE/SafE family protein [Ferruginibacter lapsinanis]|uniref:sulfite exporter TauE/SafE family protein n=1 Tax=Ferruginibacter lapsinanis TaxID=563172 RepID=UPI001E4E46EF|nr:sulfite exporter TauE/SafE family protein [Ferruginibacter lapsinanis]UEG50103.1 sulfite exporter TauE/SafE family protein [Ferruginibacter lapsinanis]